jgi:tetratricopeptide (TPR) repeat protein
MATSKTGVSMPSSSKSAEQQLESRAWKALQNGDTRVAASLSNDLSQRFPDYAPGWYLASHVANKAGQPDIALRAIDRALRIQPEQPYWLLQRAVCLGRLNRLGELRNTIELIDSERLSTAYQYSTMGLLLTQLGDRETAVEHYLAAADREPQTGRHHYNLACVLRTLGHVERAEASFNRAIELDPRDWESWKVRSELRTQTKDHNHVKQLEAQLQRGIEDPRGKAQLCYALAKELEDLGDWSRSFRFLKLGADTRRAQMKYDIKRDVATIERIIEEFTPDVFAKAGTGCENPEPIFILGMPRTGTTLVERILSSHSEVFAAGELNNFAAAMMAQARRLPDAQGANRDDLVRLTTRLDFEQLGRAYIGSTRPLTGHCARFIDKMPLNFLYLGLIHLAMQRATIISVQRHPVDTCYAVYKQLFVDAYPFSYDLQELATYFAAYRRLMAHWQAVLPKVIYTISYEELVQNFEPEARRLLSACGLDWQPACLRFHENRSASFTASTTQVRQPIYRSSVGKWRRYERELKPLLDALRKAGVEWD